MILYFNLPEFRLHLVTVMLSILPSTSNFNVFSPMAMHRSQLSTQSLLYWLGIKIKDGIITQKVVTLIEKLFKLLVYTCFLTPNTFYSHFPTCSALHLKLRSMLKRVFTLITEHSHFIHDQISHSINLDHIH